MAGLNRLAGPLPEPVRSEQAPLKWRETWLYQPDPELVRVLEVAIALRQPLLLTGDPGCGKTSAAYWAAWRMGLRPEQLEHVQIRSDATAESLKYEFDAVRYLRETRPKNNQRWEEWRRTFIRPGPLWRAFEASRKGPAVLLLDEIDKAPRDLPNDLLHEFDALEFEVPDVHGDDKKPLRVSAGRGADNGLQLIAFTSNGERKLPDAFLRRCLHHHLSFDADWLRRIVAHRLEHEAGPKLSPALVTHAVARFVDIQSTYGLHHRPGPAELLVWLRVLAVAADVSPERLAALPLAQLPFLGALLKDQADRKLLPGGS